MWITGKKTLWDWAHMPQFTESIWLCTWGAGETQNKIGPTWHQRDRKRGAKTNLPRSCGGIRAFPAAFLASRGCGCVLGNLLRESWRADPFDSLFLDAFSAGGPKRSATSGRSNDGVGRETLLELMDDTMFLERKDKLEKLRTRQYQIKPRCTWI